MPSPRGLEQRFTSLELVDYTYTEGEIAASVKARAYTDAPGDAFVTVCLIDSRGDPVVKVDLALERPEGEKAVAVVAIPIQHLPPGKMHGVFVFRAVGQKTGEVKQEDLSIEAPARPENDPR